MTAFDRGRIGSWHTSINSFKPTDGNCVAGYKRLSVSDIFCNPYEEDSAGNFLLTGPVTKVGSLMNVIAADGFHPQFFIDGTHTTFGRDIAQLGIDAINRLQHTGAIQFDVEGSDDWQLARTCCDLIDAFRAVRPSFIYALNIVATKAYTIGASLPDKGNRSVLDRMRFDSGAHLRIQQGFGNEEGVADLNDEIYQYVTLRGFPAARLSFTYVVCLLDPATLGKHGQVILPGFINGQPVYPISRGDIYNSNLLREKGLI